MKLTNLNKLGKYSTFLALALALSSCGDDENTAAVPTVGAASACGNVPADAVVAKGTGFFANTNDYVEITVFRNGDGSLNATGRFNMNADGTFGVQGLGTRSGCLSAQGGMQIDGNNFYTMYGTLTGPGATFTLNGAHIASSSLLGAVAISIPENRTAYYYFSAMNQ